MIYVGYVPRMVALVQPQLHSILRAINFQGFNIDTNRNDYLSAYWCTKVPPYNYHYDFDNYILQSSAPSQS